MASVLDPTLPSPTMPTFTSCISLYVNSGTGGGLPRQPVHTEIADYDVAERRAEPEPPPRVRRGVPEIENQLPVIPVLNPPPVRHQLNLVRHVGLEQRA